MPCPCGSAVFPCWTISLEATVQSFQAYRTCGDANGCQWEPCFRNSSWERSTLCLERCSHLKRVYCWPTAGDRNWMKLGATPTAKEMQWEGERLKIWHKHTTWRNLCQVFSSILIVLMTCSLFSVGVHDAQHSNLWSWHMDFHVFIFILYGEWFFKQIPLVLNLAQAAALTPPGSAEVQHGEAMPDEDLVGKWMYKSCANDTFILFQRTTGRVCTLNSYWRLFKCRFGARTNLQINYN